MIKESMFISELDISKMGATFFCLEKKKGSAAEAAWDMFVCRQAYITQIIYSIKKRSNCNPEICNNCPPTLLRMHEMLMHDL